MSGTRINRRLFCELGPLAYRLSALKCRTVRRLCDLAGRADFARETRADPLPEPVYRHSSLIRRKLGNLDLTLQENKAHNLALAAPLVSGILIRPGETFSFWRLVGNPSARRGYREGLTIANGETRRGVGGGMCQLTNLLHWMVLHTPLEIVEHHHHDGYDLFPDFHRQVPFGTGTSILFNYLDYRLYNGTDNSYQILVWTDDTYLRGELRAAYPQKHRYHVKAEGEGFVEEGGTVYRVGEVWRAEVDPVTGNTLSRACIRRNHAKVMYNTAGLQIDHKTTAAP